ncbi:hypothetical protein AXF17_02900 [Mogibacterium pumilum]|uniref:Uncharacterized protein n=1 Tax=Mogibacterium pumilum TaxID=86332 RepID=A0A223ARA2_9FIRM|nr:hypothetical protein AXF17_02900 [Mogibacterium pumilum]
MRAFCVGNFGNAIWNKYAKKFQEKTRMDMSMHFPKDQLHSMILGIGKDFQHSKYLIFCKIFFR